MGYIERTLMPGERVVLKAQLHWAMFLGPTSPGGLGCALLVDGLTDSGASASSMACIALLLFLFGLLYLLSVAVIYFTTEFAVTDKRVIAKTGFLQRRSLELLLTKVESIGVTQPLIGRLFNYGTIVVVGTGGTKESFPNIMAPMEFRRRINTQIAGPA